MIIKKKVYRYFDFLYFLLTLLILSQIYEKLYFSYINKINIYFENNNS